MSGLFRGQVLHVAAPRIEHLIVYCADNVYIGRIHIIQGQYTSMGYIVRYNLKILFHEHTLKTELGLCYMIETLYRVALYNQSRNIELHYITNQGISSCII